MVTKAAAFACICFQNMGSPAFVCPLGHTLMLDCFHVLKRKVPGDSSLSAAAEWKCRDMHSVFSFIKAMTAFDKLTSG